MFRPLVSICIPSYNGARWIAGALRSALAQTYAPLEILVLDDASTDGTLDVACEFTDERLRIEKNPRNLGLAANWNECVRRCRGSLVKFLFQDDFLQPECVARLVPFFEDVQVGLAFCRREILLDDPSDPLAQSWSRTYAVLDEKFARLEERNSGRGLFEQYLRRGFRENLVGEPTCVMVRKSAFERAGLFHQRMHQGPDFEMWIRLMFYYDVGFLPDSLCSFRFHRASLTSANHLLNRPWLDMLWLIEGLLEDPEIRAAYPEIRRLRLVEGARVVKRQWERLRAGAPLPLRYQAASLAAYWRYRLQALRGQAPALHV
jgi:glycosyltransferase involved in cell wall biosynthesis